MYTPEEVKRLFPGVDVELLMAGLHDMSQAVFVSAAQAIEIGLESDDPDLVDAGFKAVEGSAPSNVVVDALSMIDARQVMVRLSQKKAHRRGRK